MSARGLNYEPVRSASRYSTKELLALGTGGVVLTAVVLIAGRYFRVQWLTIGDVGLLTVWSVALVAGLAGPILGFSTDRRMVRAVLWIDLLFLVVSFCPPFCIGLLALILTAFNIPWFPAQQ